MKTRVPTGKPSRAVTGCAFALWVLASGCGSGLPEEGRNSDELRDVALEKPVRVTSTGFWRTPASHVTDGNPETAWRAVSSDPLPYYVEVDLEDFHEIERIELVEGRRGGAFRLGRFGVFSSVDGHRWRRLGDGGTIGEGVSLEVDPHPARYVRLVIKEDDGLDLPMIARIAVFSRGGEGPSPDEVPEAGETLSGDRDMLGFGLKDPYIEGEILGSDWPSREIVRDDDGFYRFVEHYDNELAVVVPEGTDLRNLTAVFETNGESVEVDGESQESGVSRNDFREPVHYRVVAEDGSEEFYVARVYEDPSAARVTVYNEVSGQSMLYVGYSAMNLTESDNLSHWYAYSNVNGVRYWLTPGRQVGRRNVTPDEAVTDADSFDERKDHLRQRIQEHPLDDRWIDWEGVEEGHRELFQLGTRHTSGYALSALRELGIEIIAELNDTGWADPFENEAERWQRAWVLWQMFYAQSYYLARHFDVWHYQGPNEPEGNLGQFSATAEEREAAVDRFVFMNAVYADAMRSAVEDVNRIHGKQLEPIWGAPTLASSPTSDVSIATLRANRTDYRGEPVDFDITDWFIMQSYSGRASSFLNANASAREVMREHNPTGEVLPVAYTEFNYMPGSVWRNQDFTSDAPHVFGAMARVWAESMADGVYGMFQFRIGRPINFGGNHVHHMFRTHQDPAENLFYGKPYEVSSEASGHSLDHVLKNASSRYFSWRTEAGVEGPHTATWDLGEPKAIRSYVMNLGTAEEGLTHGALQYWDEAAGEWRNFPHAEVRNGDTTHYGGTARQMPTHNRHSPLSSVPTVLRARALEEPVRTSRVRFYSEDSGQITVRRLFVSGKAHGGDIGGPMKSAEVTRLFAEAFQGGRPLYRTTAQVPHDDRYTAYTAFDEARDRYAIWIPHTGDRVDYATTIDLSRLDGVAGGLVTVREVSATHFGDVIYRDRLDESGQLTLKQPKSGVWLVTLQRGNNLSSVRTTSVDGAQIGLGAFAATRFEPEPEMLIRQNTADPDKNRAVYLKYDLSGLRDDDRGPVLLRVRGRWVSEVPEDIRSENDRFTIHAYGLDNSDWRGESLTGESAPNFGRGDSLVTGSGARPLAVMSFGPEDDWVTADVTDWVRSQSGGETTIVLLRERRHENEINDTDYVVVNSPHADRENRPYLEYHPKTGGH